MSWRAYRLLFRLETPLHIGWRRVGNCWQSRPCLPAYPLLCALAARLTESGLRFGGNDPDPYYITLAWLREHVRLTYFFPALVMKEGDGRREVAVFLPCYKEDGSIAFLRQKQDFGDAEAAQDSQNECPAAEFDYLFMDAQARTALSYPERSALEGALYHFEFLRPYTRAHECNDRFCVSKPVYLTGYVLFDDEAWKELLEGAPEAGDMRFGALFDRLQVGGERRLGWGLLRLADKREVSSGAALFGLAGAELDLAGDAEVKPAVQLQTTDIVPVLAHTIPLSEKKLQLTGPVEVMLRRETRFKDGQSRAGADVVVYGGKSRRQGQDCGAISGGKALPLFAPGSRIKAPGRFVITGEGLWQPG